MHELTRIRGIGQAMAERLAAVGVASIAGVAALDATSLPGPLAAIAGAARWQDWIGQARAMVPAGAEPLPSAPAASAPPPEAPVPAADPAPFPQRDRGDEGDGAGRRRRYRVLSPVALDGRDYAIGEMVPLTPELFDDLKSTGAIEADPAEES